MNEERKQILKMVETGQITPEEGLTLLNAVQGATLSPSEPISDPIPEPARNEASSPSNFKGWWVYPTATGAVVMAVGAPLMALGLTDRTALFWAVCCGWVPFLIGLTILTLGVWSRNARWLHLRVTNADGKRRSFALSLPLPLTLAAWVLRFVRPHIPHFQETSIDEAILSLRDGLKKDDDQPIFIDVQDNQDGERVTIYIG